MNWSIGASSRRKRLAYGDFRSRGAAIALPDIGELPATLLREVGDTHFLDRSLACPVGGRHLVVGLAVAIVCGMKSGSVPVTVPFAHIIFTL